MVGPADGAELERRAFEILQELKDPEIPTVSVLELGLVRSVKSTSEGLRVEFLPTFLGCPALDLLKDQMRERLAVLGKVDVALVRDEAWTTQRITEEGRVKLRASGFAPPQRGDALELNVLQPHAECPYCGSDNTVLENPFGPTLCRAIHYCKACRQPFEQFKAV